MSADWGSDMAGFLAWRRANPPTDEQRAMGRGYRAKDTGTGIEVRLRGEAVPYDVERGSDPGLFWNGRDS